MKYAELMQDSFRIYAGFMQNIMQNLCKMNEKYMQFKYSVYATYGDYADWGATTVLDSVQSICKINAESV